MRRLACLLVVAACSSPPRPTTPTPPPPAPGTPAAPSLIDPREVHFASLRQLSAVGENAEAYWSNDGRQLIFQTTRPPYKCDQIMRMPADGSAPPVLVSTGKGRTTCSYFMAGDQKVLYASTHEKSPDCPPPPDRSHGYAWALYDYDIYTANADGSGLEKLTGEPGAYDAEATLCPKDGSIIFTSDRSGDPELYRMNADGSHVVQLTHTPGYDGGAFFSADCTKIVWRASRPQGKALEEYQALLEQRLIRPTQLELYVANADGSDARQVTYLGAASFAPYFFPSGKRIIFSSNYGDPQGREFDLWAVDTDGTDLERITYTGGFDGFPMFSPDGTKLAFSSNRHPAVPDVGETDVFVADWIDHPPAAKVAAGPAERFRDAVRWLADDARQGRNPGSQGNKDSADWIEAHLRSAGVEPGVAGGFRQPFEVTTAVTAGPTTAVAIDGKPVAAAAFTPLAFSASATATGAVVPVGWGIVAPELRHDDYRGKQVKGKIALVHRFVPPGKQFSTTEARIQYGDLQYKAFVAREHGAVGLIVVDDADRKAAEAPLPELEPRQGSDAGIPAVAVTRAAARGLARGRHQASIAVALAPVTTSTDNVVGVIHAGAPAGKKKPGVIVIGAHYDHLGMGGPNALDTVKAVHNGADDNASGVAAVLEVARTLVAHKAELDRDVYVVAFSAEEMGDLGSAYYVKHPPTGTKVFAMLNLDMVGRMRANHLQVLGADSAPEWQAMVEPACAAAAVDCTIGGSGYGPSDHMSFYAAGSPVLFFFTGGHLDYHKATDDADKINAIGGARVARIVGRIAQAVDGADRLTYRKVAPPPSGGDVRLRGSSLGTIPSYGEDPSAPPGMLISDVVPGGAAKKAGLRGGDRIVDINGTEIRNVHDLMFVLVANKPGTKARITFVRAGKRLTAEAVFGAPHRRH
jgi:Tol biopolymer transport system component